ncbi:MAG TPA: pyridoxamine 5'-phosphate oxidase family protein [Kribbella sp.]|nr:pyridoxamine 5'-phosphate oxidase family protein [Kribbella sp.]
MTTLSEVVGRYSDEPFTSRLARTVQHRRAELGLTRQEVAARANLDPDVIARVEGQPVALTAGMLIRLADALETSVTSLVRGLSEEPPGRGRAGAHPVLVTLSVNECRRLLSRGGVGRVAIVQDGQPLALPVNYTVRNGRIIFRTGARTTLAQYAHGKVGFEVDRVDDGLREGWSVLATGRARMLTEGECRAVTGDVWLEPWADGVRDVFFRIDVDQLTGRRIRAW